MSLRKEQSGKGSKGQSEKRNATDIVGGDEIMSEYDKTARLICDRWSRYFTSLNIK